MSVKLIGSCTEQIYELLPPVKYPVLAILDLKLHVLFAISDRFDFGMGGWSLSFKS